MEQAKKMKTTIKNSTLLVVVAFLFLVAPPEISAAEKYELSGRTGEIKIIDEDERIVRLEAMVHFELKNTSWSDLILFKEEFEDVELQLFPRKEFVEKDRIYGLGVVFSMYLYPGNPIQKGLDRERPPSDLTFIVRSGEAYKFSKRIRIYFAKTRDRVPNSLSEQNNILWSEINNLSPAWMMVTFEVFPDYVDNLSGTDESFGKVLRERWKKYGYLLTDNVVSGPIQLNMATSKKN